MRKLVFASLVSVAALSACKSRSTDADNTAKNERDRSTTPTADNAVKSSSDRDVTQQIRKSVMDDSTLSTNAHNCKIVVRDGVVTLAGPVASNSERTKIAQLAAAVVGDAKVTNQLEVTN
jgi:osmotically-inducible protein OsmY